MKNKKNKIVVLGFIAAIIIGIISYYVFHNSKKLILEYAKNIELNINEEYYNLDNIKKIENGSIITSKEKIDTSKIGSIEISFDVKDCQDKVTTYQYTVQVVDKVPPVITFNKLIETNEGTEIDLLKGVTVTDNSNTTIIPKIEGEYDLNKSGEYQLYYVAEDESKNSTREEFTLKVNKKKSSNNATSSSQNSANNSNNNNPNNGNVHNSKDETTFTTSKGFKGITKNGVTYIDGYLVVNKTYSLPANYGSALTNVTLENFNKMKNAATLEGLNIYISSGFRSYNTQNNLYNGYVKRDGKVAADTYSARAGHSEHQSGLAFDVNIINDTFANTAEAKWLAKNCYKYGFILRYPKGKSNETGYKYEAWHFRYVGEELATKLYNQGDWITMEDYFGIISEYAA